MKANFARNKSLVKMRDTNPKKHSFSELGIVFGITKQTAHEIYLREKMRKKSSGVIHS